jgi:hypothetical protein
MDVESREATINIWDYPRVYCKNTKDHKDDQYRKDRQDLRSNQIIYSQSAR